MVRPFSFDDVIFAPGIARLLEAAPPRPGDHVLDLACGSGIAARRVGEMVHAAGRVAALDIGPNILKKARSLCTAPAPVDWVRGDGSALPFADGVFDLVLCHQGLQFFSRRSAAIIELRRVTARSGRVAVMAWARLEHCPSYQALATAIAEQLGETAAGFAHQPFALADRRELADSLQAAFGSVEIREIAVPVTLPSTISFATAFVSYLPPRLVRGRDLGQDIPRVAARVADLLGTAGSLATSLRAHLAVCRD